MKKVIINSSGGGSDIGSTGNGITEKDITLKISNIIKDRLEEAGVEVLMLRDKDETISYDERIKKLKATYPNPYDVVLLSNTLNTTSGIDIIYPLKKTDALASMLARNLEYFNDTKYYQYRWPTDTTKDYYYLTRNTPDYETVIIRYGLPSNSKDANIIKENYDEMALSVADALLSYLGVTNIQDDEYIVSSGDTLYALAKRFNTTVDDLKSLNNLKSDLLSIGQILKIPSVKEESNTYTVKSGDRVFMGNKLLCII